MLVLFQLLAEHPEYGEGQRAGGRGSEAAIVSMLS